MYFFAAFFYSLAGQGGASAYLAVMALFGLAPEVMKPTALLLNIFVALIATWKYYKAGAFSWSIFIPITLTAIPFSFFGGYITVSTSVYNNLTGIILLIAAIPLFIHKEKKEKPIKTMPLSLGIVSGGVVGSLSGLVGVGGGIFLSPLLLLFGWANARTTSGISAMFILVISTSGMIGHLVSKPDSLPNFIWIVALVAIAGGWIGSHIGSRKAANGMLLKILATVLVIAGAKLIIV